MMTKVMDIEEIGKLFDQAMEESKKESEAFWNSLTHDQQLMAFTAVIRRIYDGDVVKKGTYRYVLYDVFGFDTSSYMLAQDAGYLDIHNLIGAALCNPSPSPTNK